MASANPSVKLVVEVDGGYHSLAQIVRGDQRRDTVMARLGWRVLRFSNVMVQADMPAVVAQIRLR